MQLRCTASPLLSSTPDANGRGQRNRLRLSGKSPARTQSGGTELATTMNDVSMLLQTSASDEALSAKKEASPSPATHHIGRGEAPQTIIKSVHYAHQVRMLAATLADGRVALLSFPNGGVTDVDQARLVKWVYRPLSIAARAVSAAIQPSGHYLAIGLAHGRVAVFSMATVLSSQRTLGVTSMSDERGKSFDSPMAAAALGGGGGGGSAVTFGAGQPEADRILSLTEWGYSSRYLGAAHAVQWSPDGKVIAVGYANRGLAVWTPSGCRIMCTLRQAARGMSASADAERPRETALSVGEEHPPPHHHHPHPQQNSTGGGAQETSLFMDAREFEPFWSPNSVNPQQEGAAVDAGVLERGVVALAWSQHGYSLTVVESTPPFILPGTGQVEKSFEGRLHAASAVAATTTTTPPLKTSPFESQRHPLQQQQQRQQHQQQQQLLEISFARSVQSGHRVAESRQGQLATDTSTTPHYATTTTTTSSAVDIPEATFALQGEDRLLLALETMPSSAAALHAGLLNPAEAEAAIYSQPDLMLQHVRLPQQYLDSAFPILHVSVSPGRRDVVVAGSRGLAVLNCKTRRWRLFGDAMQERRVKAHALTWLPRDVIAVAAAVDDTIATSVSSGGARGGGALSSWASSSFSASSSSSGGGGGGGGGSASAVPAVLLFPRDHLDFSSLLARYPLQQLPVAMDAVGPFVALAFAPLEITLMRVEYSETSGTGKGAPPRAMLTTVRELSILRFGGLLKELTLLPPPLLATRHPEDMDDDDDDGTNGGVTRATAAGERGKIEDDGPSHCVLLRGGGVLSLLDLHHGTESVLSDEIESYWLPLASGAKPALPGAATAPQQQPPPLSTTTPSPLFSRNDSAAAIASSKSSPLGRLPSDPSPAAKGAAWLERHASDAASMADDLLDTHQLNTAAGSATTITTTSTTTTTTTTTITVAPTVVQEAVEMPWWTYGSRGMQMWFPSSLFDPALGGGDSSSIATDPELEFDKEVYPIGISLAEVSIVGMTQRTARSGVFSSAAPPALAFHPHPESQPVLPCLLRRLLEQGRAADALELALRHSRGPHFARSLEWLLFTTLESDADAPKESLTNLSHSLSQHNISQRRVRFSSSPKTAPAEASSASSTILVAQSSSPRFDPEAFHALSPAGRKRALRSTAGPLLVAAARLVQHFPQSAEIVVSVARKTDAQLWPALFSAAGSPAGLCEGLLRSGALQTAACCLLIVEQVEGGSKSHELALRLVREALDGGEYGLVADLLRFLMPPEDTEIAEVVHGPLPTHELGNDDDGATTTTTTTTTTSVTTENNNNAHGSSGGSGSLTSGQQEQRGTASWLWSFFSGADKVTQPPSATTTTPLLEEATKQKQQPENTSSPRAAPPGIKTTPQLPSEADRRQLLLKLEENVTIRLHRAASAVSLGEDNTTAAATVIAVKNDSGAVAPVDIGAAVGAWRAMGQHAWKLLDSGALRELAAFNLAMANVHGGLSALLSTTAREVPLSIGHMTPSAASIASALFVASNEFAASDGDGDAFVAEALQGTCTAAGCVNQAMALALMLGDSDSVDTFSDEYPAVWEMLTDLVANDVHLCSFTGIMSPPGTPLVVVTDR